MGVSRRILLDTNAYSDLMRGSSKILDILGSANRVYLSVIVIGEVLTGFRGGSQEQRNRKILNRFLERPTVRIAQVTVETAELFSTTMNELKLAGTKIPINDVWIAAHAVELGAKLVTRDAHFRSIANLRILPVGTK